MNTINDVVDALLASKNLWIASHIAPDGDAIGSSLSLALSLKHLGKNVALRIAMDDMGGPGALSGFDEFSAEVMEPDLIVVLDCGALDRVSCRDVAGMIGKIKCVNIDHHLSNTLFGDINFVKAGYSSTGEIVYEIIREAKWELNKEIAEALWVAIVTDTGRFAFDSTTTNTLLAAAELLKYGVRTSFFNDEIFVLRSEVDMKIRNIATNSLRVLYGGKYAYIALDEGDFIATGATKSSTDGFPMIPRSVRGVGIGVFFYHLPGDSKTKLSIRTTDKYSASDIAAHFGGGGHRLAAGASVALSLHKTIEEVSAYIKEIL